MSRERVKFEQALERLEKIVTAIEQGKIGMEDAMRQYEEGMSLIKFCRGILTEAELRIQQLHAEGKDGASAGEAVDLPET